MTRGIIISLFCFAVALLGAQDKDPVLFEVADLKVPVSEFDYIYTKNNRDQADYSKSSIEEYLDLYVKFKLKVKRAKELRLDTIQALQEELAGYRKQLADSYLMDKEVVDKIVYEAWERMQSDVDFSHILIKLKPGATPEDTLMAYNKIMRIHGKLIAGESFEELAKVHSEDKNSNAAGGRMGYVTALFPNGFYNMENAVYTVEQGKFSNPLRTTLGYHIIQVNETRPARGEIVIAHILVRTSKDARNAEVAKRKIEGIYNQLQNGMQFEELARSLSDDKSSTKRGGYIGSFGINVYEKEFEDAAFSLKNDGDYSKPVKTRIGWHIIKRLKAVEMSDFDEVKRKIETKISNDERIEIAKRSMIQRIRSESGLQVDLTALDEIISSCDEKFFTYQWKLPELKSRDIIWFDNGTKQTNNDFTAFMKSHIRERMQMAKRVELSTAIKILFKEFEKQQCMHYEELQLENKYPDFKALMREYEEGILLFEITNQEVWGKASKDTTGLRKFHEANRERYMWDERLLVTKYSMKVQDQPLYNKIRKYAATRSVDKVIKKFNKKKPVLTYTESKFTQENDGAAGLEWKPGYMSEPLADPENNLITFKKVEQILPGQPKALNEARGYIIADYQDTLEIEWVDQLRKKYPVRIHEDTLESLIRNR